MGSVVLYPHPSRPQKPAFQLASQSPPTVILAQKEQGEMGMEREPKKKRKKVGEGRRVREQGKMRRARQQFVKTWSPSHLTDSKRMKAFSCDCHQWCMGWYPSQVLRVRSGLHLWSNTVWQSSPQSCAPKQHLSKFAVRWENEYLELSGKCTNCTHDC